MMADEKDTRNIYQRLRDARLEMPRVEKKKGKAPYKTTNYDSIVDAVEPILLKHGIVFYATILQFTVTDIEIMEWINPKNWDKGKHLVPGTRCDAEVRTTFVNVDNPEDQYSTTHWGFGIGTDDKGPGKADTYATKSGLIKALGLRSGDDPDQDEEKYQRSAPKPKAGNVDPKESRTHRIEQIAKIIDPEDMAASTASVKSWLMEHNEGKAFKTVGAIPLDLLNRCEQFYLELRDKEAGTSE